MLAIELFKGGTSPADADLTRPSSPGRPARLILLSCGVYGNVIPILVPLTASDAVLDERRWRSG